MLNQQRVQRHRGKNHLSSHEVKVGHVVDLSGSVTFSWRAKKIQLGETVSPTIFCFSFKKINKMICMIYEMPAEPFTIVNGVWLSDLQHLLQRRKWSLTLKTETQLYRCKHAMLKFYYHCHLPVKTLTAHRACISTTVMIGPAAWNRPMTASVGGDRETGNNLLKWKTNKQMNR